MHCHIRLSGICLLILNLAHPYANAKEPESPLVRVAEKLHCADTPLEVNEQLDVIANLAVSEFGLPFDTQQNETSGSVYIASVDILLRALDETIERYPEMSDKVYDAVKKWNFCDLYEDIQYLDLKVVNGELERVSPSNVFPAGKYGLLKWGLLNPSSEEYIKFVANNQTVSEQRKSVISTKCEARNHEIDFMSKPLTSYGSLRLATLPSSVAKDKYPFKWRPACEVKIGEVDGFNQGYQSGVTTGLGIKNDTLAKKGMLKEIDPRVRQEIMARSWSKEAYYAGLEKEREVGYKQGYETGAKNRVNLALSEVIPSAGSDPVILAKPKASGYGITGSYYYSWALRDDQPSIGGTVSWAPATYWFVRGGLNYRYENDGSKKPTYSWGIGYDDWHPGSLGLQINNWGPLQFGEGLAAEKAIAAVTYKLNSKWLQSKNIGGALALTSPINGGDPALQTNFRWSPIKTWYVYTGFSFPLNGEKPTWSYGFGRQDYRPYTFTFQYNNYGPNTIFKDNFNENGTLTIGGSWAF